MNCVTNAILILDIFHSFIKHEDVLFYGKNWQIEYQLSIYHPYKCKININSNSIDFRCQLISYMNR